MRKRVLSGGICCAALLAAGMAAYFYGMGPDGDTEGFSPNLVLTEEQVAEDRDYAIQFVEDVHPYFIFTEDLNGYEQARRKYIELTSGEMSAGELQAATAEYLCFFEDGHTWVWWNEQEYLNRELDYQDGYLYPMENNRDLGKYITEIGGVALEDIYAAIDRVIPAENEMSVHCNRQNYAGGRNMLDLAGVKIQDGHTVITYSDGSEETCGFYQVGGGAKETPENSWKMDGDVFVVDLNECVDDENLQSIAQELKEAVKQGCGKVIIDVRGNRGGTSAAGERLLEAMGMKPPEYANITARFSKEAKEQHEEYTKTSGMEEYKGYFVGYANDEIDLVVLCDRWTFSAATQICVWVRDGGLGILAGEPSANTPTNYGDVIYLTLSNSQIKGTVSHKRFVRPDEDNEERLLVPDIQTSSEEAYQEAMDYLEIER